MSSMPVPAERVGRNERELTAKNCVLLFVKYPTPGHVKVRLISRSTPYNVVHLYRYFVVDLLTTLNRSHVFLYIVHHPPSALEQFKTWLGEDYQYLAQKGTDLGERLNHAFQTAFSRGFQQVIALASDVPDLCEAVIPRAFQVLRIEDTVIGPSPDGGYYLIGFQSDSFHSAIFDDISWSTDQVFPQTYAKLQKSGRSVHVLTPWRDVDTVADLQALIQRNVNTNFRDSHTMTYLRPYQATILSEGTREGVS
jgi:rSAM/selenodomain-associated transferase 1